MAAATTIPAAAAEPPRWIVDVSSPSPPSKPNAALIDPPGYTAPASKKPSKNAPAAPDRKPPTTEETDTLKLKKAWEIALAPAKSLPMQAIGQYMAGNSLQIFSIFMVYTLFKTPFSAILNIGATFSRFETEGTRAKGLWLVKIVFVLTNLLVAALGVWKVGKMGLLPTTRSDWLAWETERESREFSRMAFGGL